MYEMYNFFLLFEQVFRSHSLFCLKLPSKIERVPQNYQSKEKKAGCYSEQNASEDKNEDCKTTSEDES